MNINTQVVTFFIMVMLTNHTTSLNALESLRKYSGISEKPIIQPKPKQIQPQVPQKPLPVVQPQYTPGSLPDLLVKISTAQESLKNINTLPELEKVNTQVTTYLDQANTLATTDDDRNDITLAQGLFESVYGPKYKEIEKLENLKKMMAEEGEEEGEEETPTQLEKTSSDLYSELQNIELLAENLIRKPIFGMPNPDYVLNKDKAALEKTQQELLNSWAPHEKDKGQAYKTMEVRARDNDKAAKKYLKHWQDIKTKVTTTLNALTLQLKSMSPSPVMPIVKKLTLEDKKLNLPFKEKLELEFEDEIRGYVEKINKQTDVLLTPKKEMTQQEIEASRVIVDNLVNQVRKIDISNQYDRYIDSTYNKFKEAYKNQKTQLGNRVFEFIKKIRNLQKSLPTTDDNLLPQLPQTVDIFVKFARDIAGNDQELLTDIQDAQQEFNRAYQARINQKQPQKIEQKQPIKQELKPQLQPSVDKIIQQVYIPQFTAFQQKAELALKTIAIKKDIAELTQIARDLRLEFEDTILKPIQKDSLLAKIVANNKQYTSAHDNARNALINVFDAVRQKIEQLQQQQKFEPILIQQEQQEEPKKQPRKKSALQKIEQKKEDEDPLVTELHKKIKNTQLFIEKLQQTQSELEKNFNATACSQAAKDATQQYRQLTKDILFFGSQDVTKDLSEFSELAELQSKILILGSDLLNLSSQETKKQGSPLEQALYTLKTATSEGEHNRAFAQFFAATAQDIQNFDTNMQKFNEIKNIRLAGELMTLSAAADLISKLKITTSTNELKNIKKNFEGMIEHAQQESTRSGINGFNDFDTVSNNIKSIFSTIYSEQLQKINKK